MIEASPEGLLKVLSAVDRPPSSFCSVTLGTLPATQGQR
jgi:hypothetical protein